MCPVRVGPHQVEAHQDIDQDEEQVLADDGNTNNNGGNATF